ncbi:LOW QUALITY PROTEIN: hypothetical protein V1477_020832 [Vespula maculifrons]|uniref:Uncharacterized protein n=1 Tax=Vespula maculifrons TaxID=7453 RepID=A0ABD2AN07_VESMC
MNPRGTHAPQSITHSFNNLYDFYRYRMKRGSGDGLPLGGDIRRPPLTVHSCHEFPPFAYESSWYARSASKREGLIMKRSGGDGLPLVKRYKAADFGNGPVLSRISTSPNLSPRSTHAPENRVVWWGYFGTREVIKGDGLCQGVQSCHEFQRVHISILVVHTPRKHDRSCLEMSEADGVDSGAICKRGFIHLQFAEKPEAPEAERHLGSRILE